MSIEANLALRTPREFVRPRLSWPLEAPYGRPIAVVLAEPDSTFELADALCLEAGYVVLALRTDELEVATVAVEWSADHAQQLGADPDRLIVAGGRLAALAGLHALAEGWPPISSHVLVGSDLGDLPSALRKAGAEVVEIDDSAPMSFDRISGLRSDVDHEEPENDNRRD